MPELTIGTARCCCASCGRFFGGVGGFDAHQRLGKNGALRCLDPETIGLVRNTDGWWVRAVPVLNNGVGRRASDGSGSDGRVVRPATGYGQPK